MRHFVHLKSIGKIQKSYGKRQKYFPLIFRLFFTRVVVSATICPCRCTVRSRHSRHDIGSRLPRCRPRRRRHCQCRHCCRCRFCLSPLPLPWLTWSHCHCHGCCHRCHRYRFHRAITAAIAAAIAAAIPASFWLIVICSHNWLCFCRSYLLLPLPMLSNGTKATVAACRPTTTPVSSAATVASFFAAVTAASLV